MKVLFASPGLVDLWQMHFSLLSGQARGYICENFGTPFKLPDLGPIGSNGLANPRDFKTPVAWFEDRSEEAQLIAKFAGRLLGASSRQSSSRRTSDGGMLCQWRERGCVVLNRA